MKVHIMSDGSVGMWTLLDQYYTAKHDYYILAKPKLSDKEYDDLEISVRALAKSGLERWHDLAHQVGYDEKKHEFVKRYLKLALEEWNEIYNPGTFPVSRDT